jgi:WD40 repeat protein
MRGSVCSICFSKDGRTLFAVDEQGLVDAWNVDLGIALHAVRPPKRLNGPIAMSRDGSTVFGLRSGLPVVWQVGSDSLTYLKREGTDFIDAAAFSPDGSYIAVTMSGKCRMFSSETGDQIGQISSDAPLAGPVFSDTGNRLACLLCDEEGDVASLGVWETEGWEFVSRIETSRIYCVRVPGDGTSIWIGHEGTIDCVAADSGRIHSTIRTQHVVSNFVVVTGKVVVFQLMASSSGSGVLGCIDVATGRRGADIVGLPKSISALAVSMHTGEVVVGGAGSLLRAYLMSDCLS